MAAGPGEWPQAPRPGTTLLDPVVLVVGAGAETQVRQPRQVDLGEQPVRLGGGRPGAVVGQRHPRGRRGLVGADGVVVLRPVAVREASLVLPLAAAREDGIDVFATLSRDEGDWQVLGGLSDIDRASTGRAGLEPIGGYRR